MNISAQKHAQQISDRFRSSARSHARSAIFRALADDEIERVRGAMDAGVAVEHMAKAALAAINPTLIANSSADFHTMLQLSGLGSRTGRSAYEIKTISAHEACERCTEIFPDFHYKANVHRPKSAKAGDRQPRSDQSLFDARNAAAHLAWATSAEVREAARIMVKLVEPLIRALELDREDFWGKEESTATTLLHEKESQILGDLELKKAAARNGIEIKLKGLNDSEREVVLKLRTIPDSRFDDHEAEQGECPVCGRTGLVSCEIEDTGRPTFCGSHAPDGEYLAEGGTVDQVALGVLFNCWACGLELDYDEMAAAGMETTYERDPREFGRWEFIEQD